MQQLPGSQPVQASRGYRALLLTTVGRRTGARRRTALYYGRDGDDYLLVASRGGDPIARAL